MGKKVKKRPTKEDGYQDELDVYEIVWKLGKERNVDLLKPECIEKLIKAGRIKRDELKGELKRGANLKVNIDNDKSKKKLGVKGVVNFVVGGLVENIQNKTREEYGKNDWDSLPEAMRKQFVNSRLRYEVGADPITLKMAIYEKHFSLKGK